MIDDQFASAPDKRFQIRRRRAENAVVDLHGHRQVLAQVERAEIPVGILEHHVFEKVVGHRQRPRPARRPCPAATRCRARIRDIAPCRSSDRSGARRFSSPPPPEAPSGSSGPSAPLHCVTRRIEFAEPGIVDDAVLQSVARVACIERGLVQHGKLLRRNPARRILEGRLRGRHELKAFARSVIAGISGDDALEILGKALRLHERLPAAARAAGEVRQALPHAVERGDRGFTLERRFVHRAIAEIDQLLGMAEREARASSQVPGIGGRGGVSAPQCVRQRARIGSSRPNRRSRLAETCRSSRRVAARLPP